jgi:hypothetical protein
MTKDVEPLYDPQARLIKEGRLDEKREEFNQEITNTVEERSRLREKGKETIYQSLMRVGHNPYEDCNYKVYGETLGIDINEKKQYENSKIKKEI